MTSPGQAPGEDIPKSKHASSAPSEPPSRLYSTWPPAAKYASVMNKK